jgi:hypothetical protein
MTTSNLNKEAAAINKNAITVGFDALSAISNQVAVATDTFLDAAPAVPGEWKKRRIDMTTANLNKEAVAFNKNVITVGFDALSAISNQVAVATDTFLDAAPAVPGEWKKVVSTYVKESQKGLVSLKKSVEAGLDVDWTAKDASVKAIDAIESFYKDAVSQVAAIKKETAVFAETANKNLPKEAKSIVAFWNDSVNQGFESFQNFIDQNFALARKVTADVLVAAEPKAAK